MKEHRIVPVSLYLWIYLALMVLLLATILIAFIHLPPLWALVVTLTIAIVKAMLVLAYFMHVRYSSSMVALFAGAGFYWLLILVVLLMADYMTRAWPV